MSSRIFLIDRRWVVYAKDEEDAIQRFWAWWPRFPTSWHADVEEDVCREIEEVDERRVRRLEGLEEVQLS